MNKYILTEGIYNSQGEFIKDRDSAFYYRGTPEEALAEWTTLYEAAKGAKDIVFVFCGILFSMAATQNSPAPYIQTLEGWFEENVCN